MIDASRIWSSSQLPTFPLVAMKLLELSKNPETGIKDIECVIRTDPAICAKLLTAVNSSRRGVRKPVSSIDQAVSLLGMTEVTALAISFALVKESTPGGELPDHYKSYWAQSMVQAVAAATLSRTINQRADGEYFLAGLLIDFGRLAMLKTIPQEYGDVLDEWFTGQRSLHSVETDVLGINHVDVGIKLMQVCNLPDRLARTVEFHHASLLRLFNADESPDSGLIKATAVAAAVGDFYCSNDKGRALTRLQRLLAEFCGFSQSDVEEFIHETDKRVNEISQLLSIDNTQLLNPEELLEQANDQLANLAQQVREAGSYS